jgi:hypothetical protein
MERESRPRLPPRRPTRGREGGQFRIRRLCGLDISDPAPTFCIQNFKNSVADPDTIERVHDIYQRFEEIL